MSGLGVCINRPMGTAEEIATAIDEFLANAKDGFRARASSLDSEFAWSGQGAHLEQLYQ